MACPLLPAAGASSLRWSGGFRRPPGRDRADRRAHPRRVAGSRHQSRQHHTGARRPPTLGDLYAAYQVRLVRLAVLLVDDHAGAEDIVQEAFAGLHRNWSTLRDEAAALAYLRTSVLNGSRSALRRRRTARDYVPPH